MQIYIKHSFHKILNICGLFDRFIMFNNYKYLLYNVRNEGQYFCITVGLFHWLPLILPTIVLSFFPPFAKFKSVSLLT